MFTLSVFVAFVFVAGIDDDGKLVDSLISSSRSRRSGAF